MKKSKWLFLPLMMMSTMITISSNNWISMWMGLELNMMFFIPLMMKDINKSSSEASMMYFFTQSTSSIIMLMMMTINTYNYYINNMTINLIITISLLIKLGAAPFHLWMPEIMSKMKWSKCIILMTWQKVAPLMLISNSQMNELLINLSIFLSIIIGSIGGINQTSLRKMMSYSSINHLGWMLTINKSMNSWIIYLAIYSIMVLMICYTFMKYKLYFINQINNINMTMMDKTSMFMMMLSMGGLPPFIGFLPKWITIQCMINEKQFLLITVMILFSLITLMYYMRIMTSLMLTFSTSIKWVTIKSNKMMTLLIIMINTSLPLILMMDLFS
uniref:NADH-ubiquinone oxidoreductase chain 2 n=1 Tax=Caystrus obscurus TaxID=2575667 RepID=A0A4D6X458_9HEMI|nr:NADH dehydrogenase subunit 2 [Caystrus obscurus]QCI09300.1 NADH dehydrogenase subunit 2 [Caystrus obscurus]